MRILSLKVYRLTIPFSAAISHNLAKRSESEAIVVLITSDTGLTGIGEGTPREYVTRETLPECLAAAEHMAGDLSGQSWHDTRELNLLLDRIAKSSTATQNPSAWCALELACLDLEAQRRNVPLWNLFADTPAKTTLTYSAVITMLTKQALNPLLAVIKKREMKFVKVKITNQESGLPYLRLIRKELGPETDIRIDANGAFSADQALAFLAAGVDINISCFEQPVEKEDISGFTRVTAQGKHPTLADESFCNQEDMTSLMESMACSGFNIRLSKCGGFRESLRLLQQAHDNGFFCQIGCHVGETAILDAAGRHLATLSPEVRFLEGGYGKFVLEGDICNESTDFGHKGEAQPITAKGLGVTIDPEKLKLWGKLFAHIT